MRHELRIRFGLRWPTVGAVVAALLALGSPSALQARADCAPPVQPPVPFHVYGSFVEGGLNLYWSYDWLKVDCPATFFRVYRDVELIGKPSAAPSNWVGQDPADPPYTPPIIGIPAIPPKPAAVYVYLDKFENILVTKFESPALFASPEALEFNVVDETCAAAPVAPGGSCTIDLSFNPTTLGGRSATLSVESDVPGSPHIADLSGFSRP